MMPTEPRPRTEVSAERIVVVEPAKFAELLISRRRLERVWNRPSRLLDLETQVIYVNRADSEARLAQSA